MSDAELEQLLSPSAVARLLGISTKGVHRLCADRRIRHFEIPNPYGAGTKKRIPWSAVIEAMGAELNRVPPPRKNIKRTYKREKTK